MAGSATHNKDREIDAGEYTLVPLKHAISEDQIPSLAEVIRLALERTGLPSERALAKTLGLGPTSITHWKKGHNLPSDATAVDLAELMNMPVIQMLLYLNYWRSPKKARDHYMGLIKVITGILFDPRFNKAAILFFLAALFASPSETKAEQTTTDNQYSVYYGKYVRRWDRRWESWRRCRRTTRTGRLQEGKSIRTIAKATGTPRTTAHRILEQNKSH